MLLLNIDEIEIFKIIMKSKDLSHFPVDIISLKTVKTQ